MKPSIKLDPKRLKLYRTQRGMTQAMVATRAIDLPVDRQTGNDNRPRMYQRIEETGITSPSRAGRIATVLGVTVDDLRYDANNLQTLWWISDPFSKELALGSTVYGLVGVMHEIEKIWKVQKRVFIDTVHIFGRLTTTKNKFVFEFSQEEHERTLSITLRPCRLLTETGLLWRDIDDLEAEYFLSSFTRFIFKNAHTVMVDGRRSPPEDVELCYRVNISRSIVESNSVKNFMGSKQFKTQGEFYLSLGQWLSNYESEKVKYSENHDGIIVDVPTSGPAGSITEVMRKVVIQVGWIDLEGQFQVAPLPLSDRQYFIDRNSRLLQFLHNSEYDAPISSFEPELKLVSQEELRHET